MYALRRLAILFLLTFACFLAANAQVASALQQVQKLPAIGAPVANTLPYGFNSFRNNKSFLVSESVVTFFLRGHKDSKAVLLAASFTDWQTNALPMTRTDSGWIALVKLQPGRHLYKFIVDGEWTLDSDNLHTENNGSGGFNSVYYVTNYLFTVPGFGKAKSIFLFASFNNWRMDELPMQKTTKGWDIPLYLTDGVHEYKLLVDGMQYAGLENRNFKLDRSVHHSSVVQINNAALIEHLTAYKNAVGSEPGKKATILEHINTAIRHSKVNNLVKAQESLRKATLLSEANAVQHNTTDTYLSLASAYSMLFDFPNQLAALQKAMKSAQRWNDTKATALTLKNFGYYYMYIHVPTAIDYFKRALPLFEALNDQQEVAGVSGSLAHAYGLQRNYEKLLFYTQQAYRISQHLGDETGMANHLWNMGMYYHKFSADPLKAIDHYQHALAIYEKHENKNGIADVLSSLTEVYANAPDDILQKAGIPASKRWDVILNTQKRSLSLYKELQQNKFIPTLMSISQAYEKANQFDSALRYFKRYIFYIDQTVNVEKQKEIARLEWRYDLDQTEEYLKLSKQISEERFKHQELLTAKKQQALEIRTQELLLAKQEKELQHLAYLKMQADLQNEQLEKQQKEEQLSSAEKEKQLQAAKVKSLTQEQAIARLSGQRQWLYTLGGFALLAFASLFFINRSRLRSLRLQSQLAKEKAEQEQKDMLFQRQVADISLTALRSQMNPHFIFNCLNSIKLYTVQNDTAAASDYLTKFSKLIRLVLENSRSERITLASELKALELYIEMEAMRFKEKLRYTITVEENVEIDYIEIPPLLLQPYVENSIWHGLMHREEGGNIEVALALQEKESLLEVSITDDGVGRTKAAEIKSKTATKHRSYGMKATSDRIALINQLYKANAGVTIRDLVDPEGQPAGTQVLIQIPI